MDQIAADSRMVSPRPYLSAKAKRRMWWLKIHRWLGIALLLPMAALGLTGSALVWPGATEQLVYPGRSVSATADPAQFDASDIAVGRQALAEYGPLAAIRFGEVGDPLLVGTAPHAPPNMGLGPPTRMSAYIDPETGKLLDVAASTGGFMWYMHAIHGHLLVSGGWGRPVVGAMGIFLLVSGITGLVIWWPGRRRIMASLKWQKREGKALNTHRQSGVVLSIVLLIEALTGVWISYPTFFAALVEPGAEQPARRGGPGGGGPPAGPIAVEDSAWVDVLAQARAAQSGRPVSMEAPTADGAPWRVTLASGEETATVTVPAAGGPVEVSDAPRGGGDGRAQATARFMREAHYAAIGGVVWEWLVFLSGLVLAFLSFTGVYVWAKRKLRRR